WNVRAPLGGIVADKVVALARQFFQTRHGWLRVCSNQLHAQERPGIACHRFVLPSMMVYGMAEEAAPRILSAGVTGATFLQAQHGLRGIQKQRIAVATR